MTLHISKGPTAQNSVLVVIRHHGSGAVSGALCRDEAVNPADVEDYCAFAFTAQLPLLLRCFLSDGCEGRADSAGDLLDFEQILLDCKSFSLFCLSHVTVTDRLETLNKNFLFEYPEIINQTYTGCI